MAVKKDKPDLDAEAKAFYDSTCFWSQLRKNHEVVWPSWDIPVAALLTVVAALFIQCMIPGKYLACMVQNTLLPMMGITSVFILFALIGLAFAAYANDKYTQWIGLNAPDAFAKYLFLFRWNAAMGIATVIAGFFIYLMSHAFVWSYLIFLFMFFYTLLSTGTLFGSIAKHGIYKYEDSDVWNEEDTE